MSTGSVHPAETNGGTITSWLPLTESWSPPTQCYSTFLNDGSQLVLFDPSLGSSFTELAWCLPGEVISSYEQPQYGATTTNLGPFLCPSAFAVASQGSSLGAGTTVINCCPSGFTWATVQTSQYCTSSLSSGQTITYAPASTSALSTTTLKAPSYAVAHQIYGFDFAASITTSSSSSSSTSNTDTDTNTITDSNSNTASTSSTTPTSEIPIATAPPRSSLTTFWSVTSSTYIAVAAPTATQNEKGVLTGGAIGAIVAGAAVACLCIIAAYLWLMGRQRRRGDEKLINGVEQKGGGEKGKGKGVDLGGGGGDWRNGNGNGEGDGDGNAKGNWEGDWAGGKTAGGVNGDDALKMDCFERPEFVGGAEMDATPICELHGDCKPFELVGSGLSGILSDGDKEMDEVMCKGDGETDEDGSKGGRETDEDVSKVDGYTDEDMGCSDKGMDEDVSKSGRETDEDASKSDRETDDMSKNDREKEVNEVADKDVNEAVHETVDENVGNNGKDEDMAKKA